MKLLLDLNRQDGLTIIMVTHNRDMALQTGNVLHMQRGKLLPSAETGQSDSAGIERLKLRSAS